MEERETVALRDDEGNVVTFEHLMTVNYRHKDYVILAPAEPMEGVGEDEAVVLETTKDENGDTCYKGLDDELLLEAVFAEYLALTEEAEDEV